MRSPTRLMSCPKPRRWQGGSRTGRRHSQMAVLGGFQGDLQAAELTCLPGLAQTGNLHISDLGQE